MLDKLFSSLNSFFNEYNKERECDCEPECNCEPECKCDFYDLNKPEDVERICEAIKDNPFLNAVIDFLGLPKESLEATLKEASKNILENLNEIEEDKLPEEVEEILDELDDEFDNPLKYSERITPAQTKTVSTLVDEFVGDMIVNSSFDYSEEDVNVIKNMLTEYSSFILLHE